jgi:hypothetical protein
MSQEIAKQESKEVAAFEGGAWGAASNVAQEDLIVGKVLLMQPQSRSVIKSLAKQGEMRNSLDNKLYSDKNGEMEVVVFYQDKVWIEFENGEWTSTYPWTQSNSRLPWNEQKGSVKVERQKAINFYAVVKDADYTRALPVIIRMKGTSYNTGKRLATLFATMANDGKPSAAKAIKLTCKQEENDKGVFYVWGFEEGKETTVDEQKVAYKWYVSAKKAQMQVDESDVAETRTGASKTEESTDDVDFL